MPASELNPLPFPSEVVSFVLTGTTKVGNSKLKFGAGGTSTEEIYGLFMPIICARFAVLAFNAEIYINIS